MMMIGMVTTTAAAAIEPVGWANCEFAGEEGQRRRHRAGARRWTSAMMANRKSFQAKMKTRMAAVNTPGAASGAITLRNAWKGVAPSTRAALSRSQGISRKNADKRPDGQRQREGHVRDDQPRPRVVQAHATATC